MPAMVKFDFWPPQGVESDVFSRFLGHQFSILANCNFSIIDTQLYTFLYNQFSIMIYLSPVHSELVHNNKALSQISQKISLKNHKIKSM